MKTTYNDYVIIVRKVADSFYGNGYEATFYIPKNDGTKENLCVITCYDKYVKSKAKMKERVQKIIDLGL